MHQEFCDASPETCFLCSSGDAVLRKWSQAKAGESVRFEVKIVEVPAWNRSFPIISVVLLLSFAGRFAALKLWGTGAIEADGSGYVRLAEELRKGVAPTSIMGSGLELNAPPLIPILIATTSFATRNYEQAGRLVSLFLGALLPLPVYGIALRIFNRRAALVAAGMTLLHPVLLNLSITVLPEGPYAMLLLSAVYLVLRASNCPSIGAWLLVGGAFGLAYLVRPEVVAPLLIAAGFAITSTQGNFAVRCKRATAALVMFAVAALPEVIFVYRETGKVVLSAKSSLVFALSARVLAAEGDRELLHSLSGKEDEPSSQPNVDSWEPWQQKWAANAINADLKGTGIWMRPNAEVIRQSRIRLKQIIHIVGKGMRRNAPAFLEQISSKWLGGPFLPALALLGVLRRPWPRPVASSRLFVLLVPATSVLATFSALWTYPRFYFILIPFLLIWAANGLVEIGLWVKVSLNAVGWQWFFPRVAQYVIPGLIGLITVLYPLTSVRALYEFSQLSPASQIVKRLGLWIGQQQGHPVTIMGPAITLAFYAHGQAVLFPYCGPESALRFLDAAKVDYVVLRRGEKYTHYYEDWITKGIPDRKAELLHVPSSVNDGQFVVYRWHRNDSTLTLWERTNYFEKFSGAP
jgi:4-amino-4-deoxy-L-arabinose transferase-like glycosyltransferase